MRGNDALEHNPKIERQALEALHEPLFGWCLSRSDYERTAAEDLMQQAYVELLSGRAQYDGRSSLKTFVFGVVQMLVRGRHRRRASRLRLATSVGADARGVDYPDFGDDAQAKRVWTCVQELPARQRDVIELVFCRELTIEEAASVMQISLGAGRAHYDRAKRALAVRLADLNDADRQEARCV